MPRQSKEEALGALSRICRAGLFAVFATALLAIPGCTIACASSNRLPPQIRRREVSAYDAPYLALAVMQKCELWTNDQQFAVHAKPGYDCVRLLGEDLFDL